MHLPPDIDAQCGIYRIVNRRNGKFYVGSTKNFTARKQGHLSDLRQGKHHSDYLQRAWDKESDKNIFEFQMFIYCSSQLLLTIEQGCLDRMKPAYNASGLAHRAEMTKETRKKLSILAGQRTGERNHFTGKTHSEGAKRAMSKRALLRIAENGAPRQGVVLSALTIQKLRTAALDNRHGERNGNCKLTGDQVIEIKQSREKIRILADKFQVSQSQIKRIRYGRAWARIK